MVFADTSMENTQCITRGRRVIPIRQLDYGSTSFIPAYPFIDFHTGLG